MKPLAHRRKAFQGGVAPSYIINQGFEGTGYDNGEGTAPFWYESGSVDTEFSTAGFGMVGSNCLELDGSSTSSETGYYTFTGVDDVYAWFYFRTTELPTTISQVAALQTGFTRNGSLSVLSDGRLTVKAIGGNSAETIGTLSVNTTYQIWLEYEKGTGSDAVSRVFFSTDGTKPASGNNTASSTDGTGTAQSTAAYMYVDKDGTAQKHYFDEFHVDDVVIGSDPPT